MRDARGSATMLDVETRSHGIATDAFDGGILSYEQMFPVISSALTRGDVG